MKALMWRPKSKSTNHPLPVDVQVQISVGTFISMASLANREVSRRMAGRSLANRVVSMVVSMVVVSKSVAHLAFLCARPLFLKVGSRLRFSS